MGWGPMFQHRTAFLPSAPSKSTWIGFVVRTLFIQSSKAGLSRIYNSPSRPSVSQPSDLRPNFVHPSQYVTRSWWANGRRSDNVDGLCGAREAAGGRRKLTHTATGENPQQAAGRLTTIGREEQGEFPLDDVSGAAHVPCRRACELALSSSALYLPTRTHFRGSIGGCFDTGRAGRDLGSKWAAGETKRGSRLFPQRREMRNCWGVSGPPAVHATRHNASAGPCGRGCLAGHALPTLQRRQSFSSAAASPTRVIEVNVERRRNRGAGEREIPEKTRRPTASSGTIPTCENPVTRPGIELGSPWWEVSVLTAKPPWPCLGVNSSVFGSHKAGETQGGAPLCRGRANIPAHLGGSKAPWPWSGWAPRDPNGEGRESLRLPGESDTSSGTPPPTSRHSAGAGNWFLGPSRHWTRSPTAAQTNSTARPRRLHRAGDNRVSGRTPYAYKEGIYRMWESCRTMPLVGGFFRGTPISPALSFPALLHTSITFIGSQDLDRLLMDPKNSTRCVESVYCWSVNSNRHIENGRGCGFRRVVVCSSVLCDSGIRVQVVGGEIHVSVRCFPTRAGDGIELENLNTDEFIRHGATVAGRLAYSPPTKAIRVKYPAGSLRIFACGNCARRCRWSAGFLGDFPNSPPFHFDATPYSPQSPSSALKTSIMAGPWRRAARVWTNYGRRAATRRAIIVHVEASARMAQTDSGPALSLALHLHLQRLRAQEWGGGEGNHLYTGTGRCENTSRQHSASKETIQNEIWNE
ncbi:hypothetical protein PR048_021560 [Dryococelus australis]|uniref:Uncharacterized protein n=1 Tax=Dryococelus australis TaxID=614101 RepID=A0ABQ9GYJ2_9NEOP|nr:hypothetical protein PR048_021560 [Dryococelus australis]